jgi:hypothetical protein
MNAFSRSSRRAPAAVPSGPRRRGSWTPLPCRWAGLPPSRCPRDAPPLGTSRGNRQNRQPRLHDDKGRGERGSGIRDRGLWIVVRGSGVAEIWSLRSTTPTHEPPGPLGSFFRVSRAGLAHGGVIQLCPDSQSHIGFHVPIQRRQPEPDGSERWVRFSRRGPRANRAPLGFVFP